jgi:hypothetical protein
MKLLFSKHSFLGFSILALIVVSSCEEECIHYSDAQISSFNLPDTLASLATVVVPIQFPVSDGCGQFSSMDEIWEGDTLKIKVIAVYNGCMCTTDIPIRDVNYSYTPTKAGWNFIQYFTIDNQYRLDSIWVNS